MIEIHHRGPESLLLGAVAADGVRATAPHAALEERLEEVLRQRRAPLAEPDDAFRMRVRDVFRNGRYKPTGRGKPASEYLLRTAEEGNFPRINTLVDICNLVSLAYVLPISILDLDRASEAGTDAATDIIADARVNPGIPAPLSVTVRLGAPGESYVFNSAGQEIDLEDLIVGCVGDVPVVNAVKDSMATKTTPDTRRVLALLYAPATPGEASPTNSANPTNPANPVNPANPNPDRLRLEAACTEFARLLEGSCEGARATWAILAPDGTGRPAPAYLAA